MNIQSIDAFEVSDDKSKLQLDVIHQFLSNSYWAKNIPVDVVNRSIENSICFGVYNGSKQVGFARVITDEATFAYLADVFILAPYRGKGLSKKLMDYILAHPNLQSLRRWILATRDAHRLYAHYNFKPLVIPDRWMELHTPNVYG
jgi:GNAT superfamily N-acetyltransferase